MRARQRVPNRRTHDLVTWRRSRRSRIAPAAAFRPKFKAVPASTPPVSPLLLMSPSMRPIAQVEAQAARSGSSAG
jgi:hypothetical protein